MYFIATWSLSYDDSQFLLQNIVGNEPEGDQESPAKKLMWLIKDFKVLHL